MTAPVNSKSRIKRIAAMKGEPDPNTKCMNCQHRRWQHESEFGECHCVCGADDPYSGPYVCDCLGWTESTR